MTTVGGANTVRPAVAAVPLLPALAVVTAPTGRVLTYAPVVTPTTFTVMVQNPDAGMVAPESEEELPPPAAATVPPLQVVAPLGLAELTTLVG